MADICLFINVRPMAAGRRRMMDFAKNSPVVARALIGATILLDGVGGVIVETEAYDQSEPASHGYTACSPRTRSLFGPPGLVYVYLSYGIHWCLNVVCRERGHAAGVLIRALAPTTGIDSMQARRGQTRIDRLCSGPGRLAQALAVTRDLDGLPITMQPFRLLPVCAPPPIVQGPRIGITKAMDLPWRFGYANSPWLSRPFDKRSFQTPRRSATKAW